MARRFHCLVRCFISAVVLLGAIYCTLASTSAEEQSPDSTKWYKGMTHAHTLWSDGDEFPEMVADWYKSNGYDFLAISDHNVLMAGDRWAPVEKGDRCVPLSVLEKCQKRFGTESVVLRDQNGGRQVKLKTYDELCDRFNEPQNFLLIQNEEITGGFDSHGIHLNALNLAELIRPKQGTNVSDTISLDIQEILEQADRFHRPILAHVNHPNWSNYDISPEDLAAAMEARFVEVYNGHPGTKHSGDEKHPNTEKLWDIANSTRIAIMKAPPLFGIASDDAHHYHVFGPQKANPGRGWIMVRAKQLDANALLEAMNQGDFYASTGVILKHVAYDPQERTVSVEVDPEPDTVYTIEFIGTPKGADPAGEPLDPSDHSYRAGRMYSPEIGKVLASVEGTSAKYQLTGKELYVRAVVRSNREMPNPSANGLKLQQAWCQPIGWK